MSGRGFGGKIDVVSPDIAVSRSQEPPAAPRYHRARWKDLRLWLGVLLVVASVVLGSRLFASADDSVALWRATRDLPAGVAVAPGDFEQVRVHFVDGDSGEHLRVAAGEPSGYLIRPLGAGDLVAAGALTPTAAEQFSTVSVQVPINRVPKAVTVGSRVDVWLLPAEESTPARAPAAELLLEDVLVLEAPEADLLGGSGDRQIVLGVQHRDDKGVTATLIGAAGAGRIMVSGRSA